MHRYGEDTELQFLLKYPPTKFLMIQKHSCTKQKEGCESHRLPVSTEAVRVSSLAEATEHGESAVGDRTRKFTVFAKDIWGCQCEFSSLLTLACF